MNKVSLTICVVFGWLLLIGSAEAKQTVHLNEKWGYGFQLPADWMAGVDIENPSDRPERVVRQRMYFRGPKSITIYVSVWENLSGLNLEEWFATYRRSAWGELAEVPPSSEAEVAGEKALIFEVPATPQSFSEWIAFFTSADRCFEISYPVNDREASWPVWQSILNSFATFTSPPDSNR